MIFSIWKLSPLDLITFLLYTHLGQTLAFAEGRNTFFSQLLSSKFYKDLLLFRFNEPERE